MRQAISAAIREAIASGEFAPNQRLIEDDLAVHYGTTRAVIRAALTDVRSDGLVVRSPRRGVRVRAVPAEEALEIAEVRMALEPLCAEYAARRASVSQVDEVRGLGKTLADAADRGDCVGFASLERDLRREIVAAGGQRVAPGRRGRRSQGAARPARSAARRGRLPRRWRSRERGRRWWHRGRRRPPRARRRPADWPR
ncbi:GntR family transcriptional regulator [Amycolatopsis acidicola]|uniref:GntR family transcriptional regulator n=1 Tax=Amycolatopsis acidicola TaxID=2596893 RepID=A0A5N0V6Q6_9PSEU|nr:GntR family transcriptional regulator [Amycolatopsis acidicola]